MMTRSSNAPSIGRIQKRKTNFSKSSLSACNARPVHTDGPQADMSHAQFNSGAEEGFNSLGRKEFGPLQETELLAQWSCMLGQTLAAKHSRSAR